MDTPNHDLFEAIRFLGAVLSLSIGFLPIKRPHDLRFFERVITAVITAGFVAVLWPMPPWACQDNSLYATRIEWLAAALALSAAITYLIERQFGHDQRYRDDPGSSTRRILGGPVLTPEAERLLETEPHLSSQQVFDRLRQDPLRTWKRAPRTLLQLIDKIAVLALNSLAVLILVAIVGYLIVSLSSANGAHAFSVRPSTVPPVYERMVVAFEATEVECHPQVDWAIDGPPAEKDGGLLGTISANGTYSPPEHIDADRELLVLATLRLHRDEVRRVKLELRRHPDYSVAVDTTGEDRQRRHARFVVEVVDSTYSWTLGDTAALTGTDGSAFSRRMAAEGIFAGFEEIVAIGAASREKEKDSEALEQVRANSRANVLARWIRTALRPARVPIHALSVGRYQAKTRLTREETARERRVVIVGVVKGADPNVDLIAALRDAFAKLRDKQPLLGMYLDHYPQEHWQLDP